MLLSSRPREKTRSGLQEQRAEPQGEPAGKANYGPILQRTAFGPLPDEMGSCWRFQIEAQPRLADFLIPHQSPGAGKLATPHPEF